MMNHLGDFTTVLRIAEAYLKEARLGPERGLVIQIKRNQLSRTKSDDFMCCVDLESILQSGPAE